MTIIGGPHIAGESRSTRDSYMKEAKTPPQIQVLKIDERLTKHVWRELEDIVFMEADAKWVHHPHVNTLVITTIVSNSNVYQLLVDNGSTVDIIYLDAYIRKRLAESELSPTTSPLYRFTGDHMIPMDTAKLVVIMGEHQQSSLNSSRLIAHQQLMG